MLQGRMNGSCPQFEFPTAVLRTSDITKSERRVRSFGASIIFAAAVSDYRARLMLRPGRCLGLWDELRSVRYAG